MNQEKIGKLIKKVRKDKSLTQQDLADLLNLSPKTISKWECGKGCPDISILNELCNILGISVTELLNGELGLKDDNNATITESIKYYNNRFKRRLIVILLITLLILSPFIILSIGELGKFKNLPSYTTIIINNKTMNLFSLLESYDYKEIETLLNDNVDISNRELEKYSIKEFINRLKTLEDIGVVFEDINYDNSSYGDTVYYNISISYQNVLYELNYNMRYDKETGKYTFLICAPTHDSDKEIYKLIENVFCPGSEYFN